MDIRTDAPPALDRPAGSMPLTPEPRARVPARSERRETTRVVRRRLRRDVSARSPAVPVSLATPMAVAPRPERDPARWERFVTLITEAGVDEESLLAAFPADEDIEDILLTPDEALEACARTVVESLARAPGAGDQVSGVTGAAVPVFASAAIESGVEHERGNVRCADCRHFARSPNHPRLGRCGAGEPPTAAGGWWDTQPRACGSFRVGF